MDNELLAAIGEVAVEAAKLEYAIARLAVAARGWDDERLQQLMGGRDAFAVSSGS